MSLLILFHFLCAQHVSDINISIIRSLRLCCWITTSVVLFSVRCVLEIWCGWVWVVSVLQASACNTDTTQTQPHVVIQQHSRKLLMMDILMSEMCWVHKKCNKITRDIKLVFYSSTIIMLHGPINIRYTSKSINALMAAADYLHRVYCVAYSLKCTRRNQDISVRLDPVQVTGDPGEASRVFQLTTSCGSKRNDTDQCVGTVNLRDKWTATVSL